jgi:hypothetical protein
VNDSVSTLLLFRLYCRSYLTVKDTCRSNYVFAEVIVVSMLLLCLFHQSKFVVQVFIDCMPEHDISCLVCDVLSFCSERPMSALMSCFIRCGHWVIGFLFYERSWHWLVILIKYFSHLFESDQQVSHPYHVDYKSCRPWSRKYPLVKL